MKWHVFTLLSMLSTFMAFPQTNELLVQPYLQDATPTSIKIMWETASNEESIVEWGKSKKLGKEATGIAFFVNSGSSQIHEVTIEGLKRFTNYYYRIKTGILVSKIYQFKTPPLEKDKESFSIIAINGYGSNNPKKLFEVTNAGVMEYFKNEFEEEIPDNLALVMIPGDLAKERESYNNWKNHFFNPAQELFARVPVYPVLDKSANESANYFDYFSLPENGNPSFSERWWYTDYNNARIIGLNSNQDIGGSKIQFEWLEKVLNDAAENENIDFVFAQWHGIHPPDVSGAGSGFEEKAIKAIEQFTETSGKPSLHVSGRAQGYSRGQSKNQKHIWIHFENINSEGDHVESLNKGDHEFTVTQDEYGFLLIEVENIGVPKFTTKWISRGNRDRIRYNELRDSVSVSKKEYTPRTPLVLFPNNGTVPNTNVILNAGAFKGPYTRSKSIHAASHWQISEGKDFKDLVVERWEQIESKTLKHGENNKTLTHEKIEQLDTFKTYYWRVRYRDQNLNWSDWSDVLNFRTN